MEDKHATITVNVSRYIELLEEARFLQALKNAGVDNWSGYDYALDLYEESDPNND